MFWNLSLHWETTSCFHCSCWLLMEKYNIQNVNLYTSCLIMEHVWVLLLYFCTQCDHSKLYVCGFIIQIMVRRSMYYSDNCKAVAITAQWLVYDFVLPQIQTEFNTTMTSNKREFQYVIDSLITNSLNPICCNCLELNYMRCDITSWTGSAVDKATKLRTGWSSNLVLIFVRG
jgi:hypothetical protein